MPEHKKTALLGGSFDPVHNGHLHAAVQIRQKLNLDRVVFVPNYQNPLKKRGARAEAGARLEMLKLAVSGICGLEVSPVETEKKSVSYTADTLRLWKTSAENEDLWFAIGGDLFSDIAKWKNFGEIFEISNVAVMSRPGTDFSPEPPFEIRRDFVYDGGCMEAAASFRHKSGSRLLFLEIGALDISSTEIRNRIRNGAGFEHLVPPAVADFIKRKKLYAREI